MTLNYQTGYNKFNFFKFIRRYLPKIKQRSTIILINNLHLKFRTVNCLSINQPPKQLPKASVRCRFKSICSENFQKIFIQTSVWEFIISKIPCFQHILLNTYGGMPMKHENYSLRLILSQTFKQHLDHKSPIFKNLERNRDRNTLKMKAVSPMQVINNKQ